MRPINRLALNARFRVPFRIAELFDARPDDVCLVSFVKHRGLMGKVEPGIVVPDHVQTKRMEGFDREGMSCNVRAQFLHPLLHLFAGLLRESERKDLLGANVVVMEESRDAHGQDACLAGPRACAHEERRLVVREDSFTLRLLECLQRCRKRAWNAHPLVERYEQRRLASR